MTSMMLYDVIVVIYDVIVVIYDVITISYQVSTDHFSHLLKGLRSGCPPHGGIALGNNTQYY